MGRFKNPSKPMAKCLEEFLPRERKEDGLRSLELVTIMTLLRDEGYLCLHNTLEQEGSYSIGPAHKQARLNSISPKEWLLWSQSLLFSFPLFSLVFLSCSIWNFPG